MDENDRSFGGRAVSTDRDMRRVLSLTRILSAQRLTSDEAGTNGHGRRSIRSKRALGTMVGGGGLSGSKSQPSATEMTDDTERRKGRRRNPGDVACLALLGKAPPSCGGKVFVRRKIAGLFNAWLQYNAEIRGSYGLFFPVGHFPEPSDQRLVDLHGLISFRGCEQDVVRSPSKGEVLRLKNGPYKFLIAFEDRRLMESWKAEVRRIGAQPRITLRDFEIISPIGNGAGGKVFLVRKYGTKENLAMKVIDKEKAAYMDQYHFQHTVDERLLLELCVGQTFCVQLRYAFQTPQRFYYVMEFCEGGDIFGYMWGQRQSLGEAKTKLVAAQVLTALEHIHSVGFIYRDLKPENILIDAKGFIRVADFGLCKKMVKGPRDSRTSTICGTFSYLAPEMLSGGYNNSVDLWTFGVFIYQLITGKTPFDARSVEDARRFIRRGCPVEFDETVLSEEAIVLLRGLIDVNTDNRFGCGPDGITEIRKQQFFEEVDWQQLATKGGEDLALDVEYINRTMNDAGEDEQVIRNFDLEELGSVQFGEDLGYQVEGDWAMFPMLNWQEEGGDLSSRCLLGFDFSYV